MIGVPIDSRSCLARLISSRLALPARDDQKDRIHHAGEEQRITSGQDWRRIQEYVAELLRDRLERRTRLGPVGGSQRRGGPSPRRHEAQAGRFRSLDRGGPNGFGGFCLTEKNFNEPDAAVAPESPPSAKTVAGRRQSRGLTGPRTRRSWPSTKIQSFCLHRGPRWLRVSSCPTASGAASRNWTKSSR